MTQLSAGRQEWNAWRATTTEAPDLSGADFSGREFDGFNFAGANLRGCILTGCSLRDADLRSALLHEGRLDHTMLVAADLSGAILDGAVLAHAQMQDAKIHGGSARRADLRGVQASGLSAGEWIGYPAALDATDANLNRAWLPSAKLSAVVLDGVQARDATFIEASMSYVKARRADLRRACFERAWLDDADLTGAQLVGAKLREVRARKTVFSDCDLIGADLEDADLRAATARTGRFNRSSLRGADLRDADLSEADLSDADLNVSTLVGTVFDRANLSSARVYGASTWGVRLTDATQDRLVITRPHEPVITVNDLEVAQFIYLMLDNAKLRNVLDTVTSKTVLILGRFTAERKAVLDEIRNYLRTLDYVSIIFDFKPSLARNLTETITLLARMARFVVADLTEPRSIPQELQAIVPEVNVPVLPLVQQGHDPYAMFADLLERDSVLDVGEYTDLATLLDRLRGIWLPEIEERLRDIAQRRNAIAMRRAGGERSG